MFKKIIAISEIFLLVVALIIGGLWIQTPEGNYEPILVFIGFLLLVLEVARRQIKPSEERCFSRQLALIS